MTTLALGITATATQVDVSDESLNVARPFLVTIDSETMRVRALSYVSGAVTRWSVDRGIDSTPATHAGGVSVTLGDSGGGAALSLDNTVDAPVEITSLVATGATFVGSEATLLGKDFYAQDTDPGAVGTGSVWKDTDAVPKRWTERNAADDGWDASADISVAVDSGAEDAFARMRATNLGSGGATSGPIAYTEGAGNADARPTATSGGALLGAGFTGQALAGPVASSDDGLADASPAATTSGEGNASAQPQATATGSGDAIVNGIATAATGSAYAGSLAVRGAASAGMSAEVDGTSARMGMNGATPLARVAVADATDEASAVTRLNDLLAFLRLRGDLAP